jgi:hypothetical protein
MEDDFVTIMTFSLPHELAVIRARLESEEIECNVQNELTVQVYNLYSNAIGGIKLQVRQRDCLRAQEILKEAGYLVPEAEEPSKFMKQVDVIVLAMHNHWKKIVIALFLFVVGAFFFIPPKPPETLDVKLMRSRWCLDKIVHKGKDVFPRTTGVRIVYSGDCEEMVEFVSNTRIKLPGINCAEVSGMWRIWDTSVVVFSLDTLKQTYEGVYRVKQDQNILTLSSDSTTLILYAN